MAKNWVRKIPSAEVYEYLFSAKPKRIIFSFTGRSLMKLLSPAVTAVSNINS